MNAKVKMYRFNPLFIREIHQRTVINCLPRQNSLSFNPLFIREIHQRINRRIKRRNHYNLFQSLIHQGNSST